MNVYIFEILKNIKTNEDDEAQVMMADNFLETCCEDKNELMFCTSNKASKVLEILLFFSSPGNLMILLRDPLTFKFVNFRYLRKIHRRLDAKSACVG